SRVGPDTLADLAALVESREVNLLTARAILTEIFERGGDPRQIVAGRRLGQVADEGTLTRIVRSVLAEHPSQVAAYRQGKTAVLEWLLGQAMKRAGGRADPHRLRASLEAALRSVPDNVAQPSRPPEV
ncbi:MAG: GatB/YqeY domain-containing protein, partial [Anaerolineales bacterium]